MKTRCDVRQYPMILDYIAMARSQVNYKMYQVLQRLEQGDNAKTFTKLSRIENMVETDQQRSYAYNNIKSMCLLDACLKSELDRG